MLEMKTRTQRGWYIYILPALLIYTVFMAFPLVDSLRMSFFSSSGDFVGLANYKTLLFDKPLSERYWNAFGNNWIFFFIHLLVQNVLGLVFAVLLTQKNMKGMGKYQTIIFLPTTFAVLVTGYLWKLLLNPLWSTRLLKAIGLGSLAYPYLGETHTALIAVGLVSSWQWMGIPAMMFVAALKGISDDLMEVADIEGANDFQKFFKIKMPLIMPVIGMIAILTFVNNFNAFDIVFSMTGANGPPSYSTDLIGSLFYRLGIAGEHPIAVANPSLGATLATVTFIVLLIGVLPILISTRTKQDG